MDFSNDLKNDSLLIQEFPINGLITIDLKHSKDISFNQTRIKHFPNNDLITGILDIDKKSPRRDFKVI